jgi:hypothetical protein
MEVYNAKPSQATEPATMLAVDQAGTNGGAELITPSVTSPFDYAALGAESRIVVRQKTDEIRERVKRAAEDIVAIGERLLTVKHHRGHGRFGQWLAAEFQMNERSAQRMMAVAERFKSDNVSDLNITPSALYLLASNAVPDDVRRDAIASAKAGTPVTHKAVRGRVVAQRPMPGPAAVVMVKPDVKACPPPVAPAEPVALPDAQLPDDVDDVGQTPVGDDYGQVRHSQAAAAKRLTEGEKLPLLPKSKPAEPSGRALAEKLNETDPLLAKHKQALESTRTLGRCSTPFPKKGDKLKPIPLTTSPIESAQRILKRFDPPYVVALAANLQAGVAATDGSSLFKVVADLERMCGLQSFQLSVHDLRGCVDALKASLALDRLPQTGGRR